MAHQSLGCCITKKALLGGEGGELEKVTTESQDWSQTCYKGCQKSLETAKGKEMDSPLEFPEGHSPADILIIDQ